jgi:chemotaxis protein histidine kinase CheA
MAADATVTMKLAMNTSSLDEAIRNQRVTIRKLKRDYTQLSKPLVKYADSAKKLSLMNDTVDKQRRNLAEMRKELKNVAEGSEAWKVLSKEIETANKALAASEKSLAALGKKTKTLEMPKEYADSLKPLEESIENAQKALDELMAAKKAADAKQRVIDTAHTAALKESEDRAKSVAALERDKAEATREAVKEQEQMEDLLRREEEGRLKISGLNERTADEIEAARAAEEERVSATDVLYEKNKAVVDLVKRQREEQEALAEAAREAERAEAGERDRQKLLDLRAAREEAERAAASFEAAARAAAEKENRMRAMEIAALVTSRTLLDIAKSAGGVRLALAGVGGVFRGLIQTGEGAVQVLGTLPHILMSSVKAFRDASTSGEGFRAVISAAGDSIRTGFEGARETMRGLSNTVRMVGRVFIGLGAAISGLIGMFRRLLGFIRTVWNGFRTLANIAGRALSMLRTAGARAVAPFRMLASAVLSVARSFGRLAPRIRIFNRDGRGMHRRLRELHRGLWRVGMSVIVFDHLRRAARAMFDSMRNIVMANTELNDSLWRIRQNLWTAFAPIWQAITPALLRFLQVIEMVLNRLAMLVSIFASMSFWGARDAGEDLYNIANGYDDVADSAAAARRQVMGFDEVNQLAQDTGADAGDISRPWDIEPPPQHIIDWLEEFAEQLRRLFSGELLEDFEYWRNLGRDLGQAIQDGLNSINWDAIENNLRNLARALAEFLNGIFEDDQFFHDVGYNLYRAIRAGLLALYDFLNTFDFHQLGRGFGIILNYLMDLLPLIGDVLNSILFAFTNFFYGLFNALDWTKLGERLHDFLYNLMFGQRDVGGELMYVWEGIGKTIAAGINGVLTTLYTLFEWPYWERMGQVLAQGIGRLVNDIDWALLGRTLGAGFNALFDFLRGAITNFPWDELAKGLATSVNNFFERADFSAAGQTLSTAIRRILGTITTFIQETDWLQIGQSVRDFIMAVEWTAIIRDMAFMMGAAFGGLAAMLREAIGSAVGGIRDHFAYYSEEAGGNIALGLWRGILSGLGSIFDWLYRWVFRPFINGFKSLFGISSPSAIMEEQGENISEGLYNGIRAGLVSIGELFTTLVANIATWLFGEDWEEMGYSVPRLIIIGMRRAIDGIKELFTNVVEDVKALFRGEELDDGAFGRMTAAVGVLVAALIIGPKALLAAITLIKGAIAVLKATYIVGKAVVGIGMFTYAILGGKGLVYALGLAKYGIGGLLGAKALGGIAPAAGAAVGVKGAKAGGGKGLLKLLGFLGPKGWIAAGVIGLGVAIAANWDTIRDGVVDFVGNVTDRFNNWVDESDGIFANWAGGVRDRFRGAWEYAYNESNSRLGRIYVFAEQWLEDSDGLFSSWAGNTMRTFREAWRDSEEESTGFFDRVRIAAGLFTEDIGENIEKSTKEWRENWGETWANFKTRLEESENPIITAATNIWDNIRNVFGRDAQTTMEGYGKNIGESLGDGIAQAERTVIQRAREFGSNIISGVRQIFDIRNPSMVMVGIGRSICDGLAVGIDKYEPLVDRAMDDVLNIIEQTVVVTFDNATFDKGIRGLKSSVDWFSANIVGEIERAFGGMFDDMARGAGTAWREVQETFKVKPDWFRKNVTEPLKKQLDEFYRWYGDVSSDTLDDMQFTWIPLDEWFGNKVTDPLRNRFDEFWAWFKDASEEAYSVLQSTWDVKYGWFKDSLIEPLSQAFERFWNELTNNSQRTSQSTQGEFQQLAQQMQQIANNIQQTFQQMFNQMVQAAQSAASQIQNIMSQIMSSINQMNSAMSNMGGGGNFGGGGWGFSPWNAPVQFAQVDAKPNIIQNAYNYLHNTLVNPFGAATVASAAATGGRMKPAATAINDDSINKLLNGVSLAIAEIAMSVAGQGGTGGFGGNEKVITFDSGSLSAVRTFLPDLEHELLRKYGFKFVEA